MNDQCATGTGKFLDKLALEVLHVKVGQLGKISLRSKNSLILSAKCTVFAESEIISYLSQGERIEDMVAGMHNSLAKRIIDLGNSALIDFRDDIVFTGGVARNIRMAKAIEGLLKQEIIIPGKPPITPPDAALIKRKYLKTVLLNKHFIM